MGTLRGSSVLVTGGSRGLGLLLARQCAERGCDVTIAARDEEELERAVALLRERPGGGTVTGSVCDVRDRAAVRDLVAATAERQGGLDVVLANAGIIQVGPAEATGADGFRDAMDTMFFGALHASLEALPYLRESRVGGRLGLVGSVGGLLPVPHLLPYSCAKSAVGALAEGLRTEQAEHGVSVTAVRPGLMRTGSHLQAEFGGDADREYAWFATLAGLPLLSMNAERAAERIVSAVERRRTRLVLTPAAKLGGKAYGLAPVLVTRVNSVVARLLPDAAPGGGGTVKGALVARGEGAGRTRWQAALSALNDRASRRFNETGPRHRRHP
ncbi:SDR family NAD(P)-dependent oxidoreductase [Streptomyces sp. NPDC054796]